jgi:hypothetical protein
MKEKPYLKKFLKSTTTTLTVNGVPVKKPSKFWAKQGDAAGVGNWATYWGYDPGIVLACGEHDKPRLPRRRVQDVQ